MGARAVGDLAAPDSSRRTRSEEEGRPIGPRPGSVRTMSRPSSRFSRYAWMFCAYLLFVILFGAWVRITHSGAGCGSHWPTCNGEIVPRAPSWETLVEYSHRLTSGFLGVLGLLLLAWARWSRQPGRVLVAACVTLAFIVVEALIGAGLVLRELVANDASGARAIVIALHLANTLVLTGAAVLVAWWSHDARPLDAASAKGAARRMGLVLAVLVLAATTGAVTALGDTLFPVAHAGDGALWTRVRGDLSTANHFLVRLRIVHPILAVTVTGIIVMISRWLQAPGHCDPITVRWATVLRHAAVSQLVLGLLNIGLAAPGWMQLVHLLVAQVLWMVAVLTFVSAISVRPGS